MERRKNGKKKERIEREKMWRKSDWVWGWFSLSLSPSNPFVFEQESHSHSLLFFHFPSFSFLPNFSFSSFLHLLPFPTFFILFLSFRSFFIPRFSIQYTTRGERIVYYSYYGFHWSVEERRVKVNTEYLLLFSVSKSRSLVIISCERKREKERLLFFFQRSWNRMRKKEEWEGGEIHETFYCIRSFFFSLFLLLLLPSLVVSSSVFLSLRWIIAFSCSFPRKIHVWNLLSSLLLSRSFTHTNTLLFFSLSLSLQQ